MIVLKPFHSEKSRSSPRPWVKWALNEPIKRFTITDVTGLSARGLVSPEKEAVLKRVYTLELSPIKPTEIHVVAITLDGNLEFVPESEQRPEYYAHLGWYNPVMDTWTILDFQEEEKTNGPTTRLISSTE